MQPFLDWIKNRNATPPQPPVAQTQQPAQQPEPPERSIESLPANVKAQAVEDARPAARALEEATTPKSNPAPRPEANERGRGRSLGMER